MNYFKSLSLAGFGAIAFFFSACVADNATRTAAAEPEKGLIAYLAFDEGEGRVAKDSVGKNHGKIVNAKWVDGKVGKALDFDANSYVEVPTAPALNPTPAISIEVWVKHRGESIKMYETILAKGDSSYRIHTNDLDQSIAFDLTGKNPNGTNLYWKLPSKVKPEPDKWYFIAATYDGQQGNIYVDGKLAATSTAENVGPLPTNTWALCIGEHQEIPGRNFNGLIDEVKIYDRALSPEEVAKHFEQVK
jgi:hypothetical protein